MHKKYSSVGVLPLKEGLKLQFPRGLDLLAWSALAIVLLLGLPLFLRMPIWPDCTFYDIGARTIIEGKVLYRDILYHGFPGIVLLQAGIRAALGWSSLALRLIDFLFVSASVLLLVHIVGQRIVTTAGRVVVATVLYFCYFATTEFCHCQPDTWMLAPALAALCLRQKQTIVLQDMEELLIKDRLMFRAVVEGVCWGAAFLIKPFVIVPGLACLLISSYLVLRRRSWFTLLLDVGSVLVGGLLIGGAVVAWLWFSEGWPYFWKAATGGWASDYLSFYPSWRQRIFFKFFWLRTFFWLPPWSLIHVLAIPLALVGVWRGLRRKPVGFGATFDQETSRALFAAFYLGWMCQANLIQIQLPYQLVSPVLLGLGFLAGQSWTIISRPLRIGALCLFLLCAAMPHSQLTYGERTWVYRAHPLLQLHRLELWGRCWYSPDSADLWDRLTLDTYTATPSWKELAQVAAYVRAENVNDRELTCHSVSTVSLYTALGLEPSTRFVELSSCLSTFQGHRDEILREVRESPQRFVVSDLREMGLDEVQAARGRIALPPKLLQFYPWSHPVVFRAGRYLVHRVLPPTEKPLHD